MKIEIELTYEQRVQITIDLLKEALYEYVKARCVDQIEN
jgi:hypothetical protein